MSTTLSLNEELYRIEQKKIKGKEPKILVTNMKEAEENLSLSLEKLKINKIIKNTQHSRKNKNIKGEEEQKQRNKKKDKYT